MKKLLLMVGLALMAAIGASSARAADANIESATKPFELVDGDRVVFVGGTLIEREGQFGYIETMLTSQFPDRNITFRNLGQSGDTVQADARNLNSGWAAFGPEDQGFNRLKALTQQIKPTVIFANYGMTESFEGTRKLPSFIAGYQRLLDMMTAASGTKPRIVLISPNYHEDLGRPLPDPKEHNESLKAYCDAIQQFAGQRGFRFVNLYELSPTGGKNPALTSNGIHPTGLGFVVLTSRIATSLGYSQPAWKVDVNSKDNQIHSDGARAELAKASQGAAAFKLTAERLVGPVLPEGAPAGVFGHSPRVHVAGLAPGKYALTAAGTVLATGSEAEWKGAEDSGMAITKAPDSLQAEQLRQMIVAKNHEFFNYWRPQNDTYILGYRKGEQGRNAVEIPQFLPLVEAKEKEIAKLRVPQPVTYILEPAGK